MKHILDELNRERQYPRYFRSVEWRYLLRWLLLMVVIVTLIIVVTAVKEWVDAHSNVVGVALVALGLMCLGIWILFIRKR